MTPQSNLVGGLSDRKVFLYDAAVATRTIGNKKISLEQRAKVFKALSDPTRLRIVEMLVDCDAMCGSQIADKLGISLALLCHHWTTLEHSGLITKKKSGQTASISLNNELLSYCLKGLVD